MMKAVNEESTAKYQCAAFDPSGIQVPKANITQLRLTLYDKRTGVKLGSPLRDNQNVFDLNNVTIATDGTVTWELQPLDNRIVNTGYSQEDHVALFKFFFVGDDQLYHAVVITVNNLGVAPTTP